MDADQVTALRILLGPGGWLEQTRSFARALRGRAPRAPGELLLVHASAPMAAKIASGIRSSWSTCSAAPMLWAAFAMP